MLISFHHLVRLLNTFAEENSIADAIFHLNDALKKEVIDLEVFLKVRARPQASQLNYRCPVLLNFSKLYFSLPPTARERTLETTVHAESANAEVSREGRSVLLEVRLRRSSSAIR